MEFCNPTHPPALPHNTVRSAPQPLLCRGHSHLSSRAGVSLPLRQHVMQTTRPQLHPSRLAGPSAAGSTHSQLSSLWKLSAYEGLTCNSSSSSHLGTQSDSAGCSSGASTPTATASRCRQANVKSRSNICKPSRNVATRASSSPRLWTRLTHTSRSHPAQVPQLTVQTNSWVPTEHSTTQNFLWGPQHPANTRPSRELPHHTYLPDLAFASGDSAASFTSLFRPTSPGSTAAEVKAFQTRNNPPSSAHSTTYPDSSVVSSASAEQFNTTSSSSQPIASLNNSRWGDSTATAANGSVGGSGQMAAQAADFTTTHRLQRCTNWYEMRALLAVIGPLSLNHVHIAALLSTLVRSVTYTIGPAERIDFDRFVIQSLLGARNAFTQMTPVELSITIHALGKLGVRLTSSPQLASLLIAVTHPQLCEFTGKELAWLVWGLGRTCTGRAGGSDETSRSDTLGSGGGYGTEAVYLPAAFLQTLSDELVARFPAMNTQDLANVAVGLTLLLPPASASRPTQSPHSSHASTVSSDDAGRITAHPDQMHSAPSSSNREDSSMRRGDSSSSMNGISSGISSSSTDVDSSSSSRLHSSSSSPHPDHIHTTNGSSPSQASAPHPLNPTPFELSFWHAFAAASEQSLSDCTPQALSNIIHALAHAAYPRSRPWVQRFQIVTHAQLPACNAQSLATILGAMHRLGVTPQPKWWQTFIAAASEPSLLQAATPQDLAELSMAVASISSPTHNHQQPSFSPSNSSADGNAGHYDDSGSSSSSGHSSTDRAHHATSSHDYASSLPPFLAAFDQCLENRSHNLPPYALSTCLASMARLSHTPSPGTLHAWLASAGKQLPLFQPGHIAHTFWALATLRLAPPGRWMSLAVAVSKEGLPAASPRELALTIWSFHRLEYLPSWQWLLEWGQSTGSHLTDMNPRDLGMVLHSASRLRWRPPAKWLATATDSAMTAVCTSQRSAVLRDLTDGEAERHMSSAAVLGLQMSCILCGLHRLRSTPQLPQLQALSDTVMGQMPSYSLRHTSAVTAVLAEWFQPPRLHRTVSEQHSRSRNTDTESDSSRPERATQQRRHRRRIRLALSVTLRRGSGPNSDEGSGFPAVPQHKLHPLASLLQPAARPGSVQTPLTGLTGTRSRLATVPAPPTTPPRTGLFNRGMPSEANSSELEAVAERARRTMSELEAGLRTARKHKEQLGRNLLVQLLDTTLPALQSLARQPDSTDATTTGQRSESQRQQASDLVIGQAATSDASSEDRANPGAITAATISSDVHSVMRLLNTVCILHRSQPSASAATSRVLQQLLSSENTPVYQSPSRSRSAASEKQRTWLNTLYSVIDPHVMHTLPAHALLMLVRGVRATTCHQPPPSTWVTALLVASVNACAVPETSQEASNASSHNGTGVHRSGNSVSSHDGGRDEEHDWSRESAGNDSSSSSGRSVGSRKPLPKLAITDQVALLFSVSLIVAQQPPNQRKRQHRDVGKQLALKVMYNAMNTSTVPTLDLTAKLHAAAMARRFRLAHRPHSKAHTAQPYSHPPDGHTADAAHWARNNSPSLLTGVGIERARQRKRWKAQRLYQHRRWLRLYTQGAEGASAAGRVGMKGAKLTATQVGHLATAVALLLGPGGLFLIALAPERDEVYRWLLQRLQLAAPRMLLRQRALLPAELMQAIRERGSTLGPRTLV